MKCIHIHTKRIGELEVGDIVKGGNVHGWSLVLGVEVNEEHHTTKLTWHRPATNGGEVDPMQRGRATKQVQVLPSWDLVEAQGEIDGFGRTR
jgi:hypothetical protein